MIDDSILAPGRPMIRYHPVVIRRLYVHNFRCLENFELPISGLSSALLIGKNGAGKTTVGLALQILQKIARGTNRVGDLVRPEDLSRGRNDVPMRFEIEVELEGRVFAYTLALGLAQNHKDFGVIEEKFVADDNLIYRRTMATVELQQIGATLQKLAGRSIFPMDAQLVALPIITSASIFVRWLARMLILRPIPSLIAGDSKAETLEPNLQVTDFAAWFSGLLAFAPSAYAEIDSYLKQVMPDLRDIKNPEVGKDARSLVVQFSNDQGSVNIAFEDLSDGEKCFMVCALVLAANRAYGPVFCFWDEPDNYLSISEVGHFVLALRKAFQSGGQFIATSHNPEAIRRFSDENTLVLYRKNHLEPTLVRPLKELQVNGDLVGAMVRGDLEP
jgi:predicted ATPase